MSQKTVSQTTKVVGLLFFSFTAALILFSLSGDKVSIKERTLGDKIDASEIDEPLPQRLSMRKVGGVGSLREKDDEVVEVVARIKPLLEEKTNTKYESIEVLTYKHQTVAGKNYFVKARVKPEGGDAKIAHLRIYRNIGDDVELTAYQLDKSEDEEIVWFQ